ncbi:MAG: M15 family metallopeptidase, partial [Flavobacteriaceae bacterium]|nr:M15 family metallopeptidase [Flavobacteriaceae bacterium]
ELTGRASLDFVNPEVKLRTEAYESYLNMKEAAIKDGIEISIVSAFRSFEDQARIWKRKYNQYTSQGLSPEQSIRKIIEYSTIPGTSRHHWGTDIDIIDASVKAPKNVLSPSHFNWNGVYCPLKHWMDYNSERFGFYLVYNDNVDRKGFKYEPWHYSYKPLSQIYLQEYIKRNLFEDIQSWDIEGRNHLTKDFLEQYYQENILDISSELL